MSEIHQLVDRTIAELNDRKARLERIGQELEAIIAICGESEGGYGNIRNRAERALGEVTK